jgi:hypothetical protein
MVWSLFTAQHQTHISVLHNFNLVACPVIAAFCIWHAFRGQKPLFGDSELSVSITLGVLLLLGGVGQFVGRILIGPKYHIRTPGIVLSMVFLAAAYYYIGCAVRERRELAQQTNTPFKMKSLS